MKSRGMFKTARMAVTIPMHAIMPMLQPKLASCQRFGTWMQTETDWVGIHLIRRPVRSLSDTVRTMRIVVMMSLPAIMMRKKIIRALSLQFGS